MGLPDFRRSTIGVHYYSMVAEESGRWIPDDWLKKVNYIHPAADMLASGESGTDPYKPTNRGHHCQDCKRHPHGRRGFVRYVRVVGGGFVIVVVNFVLRCVVVRSVEKFLLAPECHRYQTRHVKRGAGRCDRSDNPHQPANRNVPG